MSSIVFDTKNIEITNPKTWPRFQIQDFIFSPSSSKLQSTEIMCTFGTKYSEKVNNLYFIKRLLINKSMKKALNQIALAKLCEEFLRIGS